MLIIPLEILTAALFIHLVKRGGGFGRESGGWGEWSGGEGQLWQLSQKNWPSGSGLIIFIKSLKRLQDTFAHVNSIFFSLFGNLK